MTDDSIGEDLRQARTRAGLSQEALAHRLGVCKATIQRWEDGKFQPNKWVRPRVRMFIGQAGSKKEERHG